MVAQASLIRESTFTWLEFLAGAIVLSLSLAAIGYSANPSDFEAPAVLSAAGGYLVAGLLMVRYGRRTSSDDGRSFALIGLALIGGAIAMVAVGVAAEFTEVAAFGLFDIVFFTVYGFLLVGLILLPAVNYGWRSQVRILLDGMVGAISIATLIWLWNGDSILRNMSDLTPVQRFIGLTYPILDVALLVGIMVAVMRRSQYRFDVRLMTLMFGFLFQVGADLSYLATSTPGGFQESQPNLLLFMGASMSFVIVGMLTRVQTPPQELPERKAPVWSYALPYAAGVLLIATQVYLSRGTGTTFFLELASISVMGLVILRQSLAIQENRTRVERERRSLIASVSHELRTPLTSMIGFLSVLDESGDALSPEERTELSGVVLEQANYMGRMVTDIVMLARDKPEVMTLTERVQPLSELVSSILDTLGPKSASLEVDFDADAWVRIDGDRVKQVAVNLLTNATRYGSGQVRLVFDADTVDLLIDVHDNGPGVPRKFQQIIFDRFERGSNEFNATTPGTGLGLSIVEMIAKAHRGSVGYRPSELLGGACFSVRLPNRVVAGHDEEITPASQPVSVRFR